MPKVTIWVRNEDYPKWQAIEDKPEWLHDHINQAAYPHLVAKKVATIMSVGRVDKPLSRKDFDKKLQAKLNDKLVWLEQDND
jgi:hypothetical protein